MLVICDTTGITVKRTINDADHVRIGVTEIALWVGGDRHRPRPIGKPHGEFTVNELSDLLLELEQLASFRKPSRSWYDGKTDAELAS